MTVFSTEEYGMMRGLWGELETMNRSLANLVEILERQPQPQVASPKCIEQSCPNARLLASGRCHYHRYLG